MDSRGAFLKGYRALDLTDLRGQLCGRVLAGLGMDVIKIEPPGGDPVRELAPFIRSAEGRRLSSTFAHLNAGKASKILDLKKKRDRDALLELVESADGKFSSWRIGIDGVGIRKAYRV
jgi:crotonobetainyl-CoA:carnitine CoA-transferase CaiB-like acyl-CoA transferase